MLFALVTAGRSQASYAFEIDALPGVVEDAGRTQGRGYYDGMLLDITATDREGNAAGLADGGRTDRTSGCSPTARSDSVSAA